MSDPVLTTSDGTPSTLHHPGREGGTGAWEIQAGGAMPGWGLGRCARARRVELDSGAHLHLDEQHPPSHAAWSGRQPASGSAASAVLLRLTPTLTTSVTRTSPAAPGLAATRLLRALLYLRARHARARGGVRRRPAVARAAESMRLERGRSRPASGGLLQRSARLGGPCRRVSGVRGRTAVSTFGGHACTAIGGDHDPRVEATVEPAVTRSSRRSTRVVPMGLDSDRATLDRRRRLIPLTGAPSPRGPAGGMAGPPVCQHRPVDPLRLPGKDRPWVRVPRRFGLQFSGC